jgi:hypothetical protein
MCSQDVPTLLNLQQVEMKRMTRVVGCHGCIADFRAENGAANRIIVSA